MKHSKDLIEIAKFLDALHASFESLCDNQKQIARAYNNLAQMWSDKVYSITGQVLTETAVTTERAYTAFSEVCDTLRRRHEILCEYQEIDEARHYGELTFSHQFVWENSNMNNGRIKVAADDIEAFEKALAAYRETLETEVRGISREYAAVGDSWADDQYTRFGEHIAVFSKKTSEQLDALEKLGVLLDKKRRLIEAAEEQA